MKRTAVARLRARPVEKEAGMMMRRRRPLMRAAMVGTAGVAVGHHMATKSQQEAEQNAQIQDLQAQQQAPPAQAAAAPAPAGGTDIASKLAQLKELTDQGALTPEEFEQAKQKLLSS
jgi:membrane protease subunit (stomatin/prohibitin family)